MKTTKRFDQALERLYNAFNNRELNAYDCKACAVGNILGELGGSGWKHKVISPYAYDYILSYPGIHESDEVLKAKIIAECSYSLEELANIEYLFMYGVKRLDSGMEINHREAKTHEELLELQFKGLCYVIEYLCELDGIENFMDHTKMFERNNGVSFKYEVV